MVRDPPDFAQTFIFPGQWLAMRFLRWYLKFSLKKKAVPPKVSVLHQPIAPARTRFAPSPTGYLHLGSLRTALYNYLLAKSTGGQFLLRLEDTDRTRLVPDAEQNIYDLLRWCGLHADESPEIGGPVGPYRQSDRGDIYREYAQRLIDAGHAYRCDCSKERLGSLRELAMRLKPPTTVTYDRKCLHDRVSEGGVVRFKSPDVYAPFTDVVHGNLNLQPQYNYDDRRYDDFVILKSDGMPTYHFANVVDDHLMNITHVIRGEEWLPSTPKHIAMYEAFGWTPPQFVHIPLLTLLADKKLSKRQGDIGILSMRDRGILPEAVVNFVALFGWLPHRDTPGVSVEEAMTLDEIVSKFSLDHLTRGNAKVNESKLYYFNKHHLAARTRDPAKLQPLVDDYLRTHPGCLREWATLLLEYVGPSVTTVGEIDEAHSYLFHPVDYAAVAAPGASVKPILEGLAAAKDTDFATAVAALPYKKKEVFQAARWAVAGGVPGVAIPKMIELLGEDEYHQRLDAALKYLADSN